MTTVQLNQFVYDPITKEDSCKMCQLPLVFLTHYRKNYNTNRDFKKLQDVNNTLYKETMVVIRCRFFLCEDNFSFLWKKECEKNHIQWAIPFKIPLATMLF